MPEFIYCHLYKFIIPGIMIMSKPREFVQPFPFLNSFALGQVAKWVICPLSGVKIFSSGLTVSALTGIHLPNWVFIKTISFKQERHLPRFDCLAINRLHKKQKGPTEKFSQPNRASCSVLEGSPLPITYQYF